MTEGNFVDYTKIHVTSGNGGKGSTHLRREKFVEKGGPDGGDGGRGGHILIRGNKNLWTLYHFKFKKHFTAPHGEHGGKNRSSGANGGNVVIEVPLGTMVRETETNELLFEITAHGEEKVIAQGGKGGLGNWHFRGPVRQTPRYAQPGLPGEEKNLTLELKVLADVGLVGFPNAGKSTLLSVVTSAKPKIANYPFTTLKPNLGIAVHRDLQTFVIADIPGIIEGASEGKGLGHRFLRHIERNAVLLFVIAADSKDVSAEYRTLIAELRNYNPELLDKKRLIAISKCDLLDATMQEELKKELDAHIKDVPYLFLSAITGQGILELKDRLWALLQQP